MCSHKMKLIRFIIYFRNREFAWIKYLPASVLCYFFILSIGHAANLEIPAFSGNVQGPEGFNFSNYHFEIHWSCSEDNLIPISSAVDQPCGGFGKKDGKQVIDIGNDGRFKVLPVSVRRFSLTRNPKFMLRIGLFQNNDNDKKTYDNEYSKRYVTGQNYVVSEQLQKDLSQLRIVRILGGKFNVRIMAKDDNGEIIQFNSLMVRYPKSKSFESTVNLVLNVSDLESIFIPNQAIDSQVKIPSLAFLQVGTKNTIYMDTLIRVGIALIKNNGNYKYYFENITLKNTPITINENLEASFDQNYLNDVDITVEVQ